MQMVIQGSRLRCISRYVASEILSCEVLWLEAKWDKNVDLVCFHHHIVFGNCHLCKQTFFWVSIYKLLFLHFQKNVSLKNQEIIGTCSFFIKFWLLSVWY
jgi:hypothetical protein